METQIKNKSILINSEQHQKVKVLADQFKVSVKQLVEDMINYSYKTGFNPTVMTRDRVMEKLDQIQKSIESKDLSDQAEIQNITKLNNQILKKIKNDFQEFYSVVSKNKDFAERKSRLEVDQIIDLTEEIWEMQINFFNKAVKSNPEILEKDPETTRLDLPFLRLFLKKTKDLIPQKNKLLPKS